MTIKVRELTGTEKRCIKDKMRVLADFGICYRYDKNMEKKLVQAILDHPNKDPREVLDYYCRPMIQAVMNSWH